MRLPLLFILPFVLAGAESRAQEAPAPSSVRAFTKEHCSTCHSADDPEAGLNIDALSVRLEEPGTFKKWVRILDRVKTGEMPPADSSDLELSAREHFTEVTSKWLKSYQEEEHRRLGRVQARRLTNLHLERTLQDLLGIDIPLAIELPDEPRTDGFTTVADGQPMSHFQLERHLGLVDVALDEAFRRAGSFGESTRRSLSARQLARRNSRRRTREPELLDGAAVVWTGRTIYYGRLPSTQAAVDGWYRFSIRASALKPPKSGGVWCTVRSGQCVSSAPLLHWVHAFEVTQTTNEWTFEAWLPKGHMLEIRPGDSTLKQARFRGGQIGAGEGGPQNVPGLAIHSMSVQRIHHGATNEEVRKKLFGDLAVGASVAGPNAGVSITSDRPHEDAGRLVRQFATAAFRRPVDDAEIEPFVAMARRGLDAGQPFSDAIRSAYRAVLCSSRFLYFYEMPGRLDQCALASRLSYFLWSTMPDAELMALAAAGDLGDPAVQRAQVERMLNDPRGQNFVKDFAHEWLDLSEIDFTQPDRRRHGDFDLIVQQTMLDETHAFLQAMVSEDLSVTNLIDSEFTFLNSRLAAHYGIDGVDGDKLQRVKLQPRHRRGGVLTQGAILKVTANGTTTSPVLRGVWVAERLLGEHIPPPPEGIPAIEPDIRGAKTIREMLAKHRSDASCASCHVKIDPPGFALENYDPAGKWRDRYYHKKQQLRLRVDPSYQLADGRDFNDIDEFRKLIVRRPSSLARNVAEKLIIYGTGAPVSFVDRQHVADIVKATADGEHGFRSLIHAVVASPLFQRK